MKRIMSLIIVLSFMSTSVLLASKYYDKAVRLYDRVEYNEAVEALDDAISREDNNKKTLIKIYYLKAKIYIILGKESKAKKQFIKLLFLNPEFRVSEDESPKILKFFKESKTKFEESLTVKLETPEIMFDALKKAKYQKKLKINAIISSMNESRDAKIFYKKIGASKFLKSDLIQVEGDNFEGTIPMPLNVTRDFALEYYIGVLDFSGKLIASYPAPEEPIILSIILDNKEKSTNNTSEINDDSILKKWWFWTAVGVVVVGAGAGTYFLVK